ncbi:hypothetical protein [Arthrobacter bambusae]|uniref:Uncharacterized protein n=1 Tax=Arthrobacter bambusae TaxID=1338426 RepID=A0AAW8DIV8_9MICC|nr:hypothetical protein [Arthrobacter bambusae]MDP9906051.1 hypothetical protein [Arthrobacter bambusae]MDQ0131154.1 hypothetical protein [Arthrobacter bambusae]MDQ0181854.1 hypothetical protein [Arthrobacter bambusae]
MPNIEKRLARYPTAASDSPTNTALNRKELIVLPAQHLPVVLESTNDDRVHAAVVATTESPAETTV